MRPNKVVYGDELYECLNCGVRERSPEGRRCHACGHSLQHIGRARDL
jgi:Zn ribbon nucleic-acid-binding protein